MLLFFLFLGFGFSAVYLLFFSVDLTRHGLDTEAVTYCGCHFMFAKFSSMNCKHKILQSRYYYPLQLFIFCLFVAR
jgi:hypothetical protein